MVLSIYDRWGEKVFESHNINDGWDVTFKGKPVSGQTFLYYLEGTYTNGESFKGRGCVTSLR